MLQKLEEMFSHNTVCSFGKPGGLPMVGSKVNWLFNQPASIILDCKMQDFACVPVCSLWHGVDTWSGIEVVLQLDFPQQAT